MVIGIDVSAFQKSISWKAIAAAGIEFGFIKATEGTTYVSGSYEPHRKAARRRGIPVGAYHFAHPDFDDGPEAEADHFLDVAAPREGDLLPVLDLERQGSSARETARWARRWLKRVEKRIGEPPILYTYSSFAQSLAGHERGLTRFPLWLANYGKNDGKAHRVEPVGEWETIAVHQFTSEGRIPGYAGPLDLNRLMKGLTLDQLRLGTEPSPSAGFGPPWHLAARGKVLHESRRLDAAFLERVAEQLRNGGGATVRGTPRELER
jgi:lysozyme